MRKKIMIWGTGNWSRKLLAELNVDYKIVAFVETKPEKDEFQGIKIIDANGFSDLYKMADEVYIAVANNDAIKNLIWNQIHTFKKIFFMVLDEPVRFVTYQKKEYGLQNGGLTNIAKDSIPTNSQYIVCDVKGISFVVTQKSQIMLKALSKGKTYQESDIENFMYLCNKYYHGQKSAGGVLLDIGANIGTTSVYIKKCIQPDLQVYAFEPVAENCKMLRASLALNDISDNDYHVVQMALSDENGSAEIMVNSNNIGDNRIIRGDNRDAGALTEVVETIRLDDYLKKNNVELQSISYIWMDVQAHEGVVLAGATDLLANTSIPLYMEIWPEGLKKNGSLDILMKIIENNYKRFICIHEGESNAPIDVHFIKNYCAKYEKEWFDVFMIKD